MHKIPVGVLGASGFAGRELCTLITGHPGLELAFAAANSRRGESLLVGNGADSRTLTMVGTDEAPLGDAAVVFAALPHGASAEWVARSRAAGAKVVDLSSDLRPGNHAPALEPELAAAIGGTAPYGLTEDARSSLSGASVVANPGCYPTAVLLALRPLARRGLIAEDATLVVNAASGVSGAGNSPRPELMFSEVSGNFRAYGLGNEHRHLPEMRATLASWGVDADLVFTPHLLPVERGILATITVPLTESVAEPESLWTADFANEPFIEVVREAPALRDVVHRNVVRMAVRTLANVRRPSLQVIAAIDNLVKGAAGQALQNANVLLGLEETAGLPA
ncbi:MAG TPA: N-acetyl-gamma-glutamyl-phosphate reductase [Gemmatimonadales bacterium]|nr:N-acetyl-gamma-glutamyl-phosphate reductase [Gemmatimonadales bacterium]